MDVINIARDLDGRKSSSITYLILQGSSIKQSKLQKCVALPTTKAKYTMATKVGKEMLWMKRFVSELGLSQLKLCDL